MNCSLSLFWFLLVYNEVFWKGCLPGSTGNLCKVCMGGTGEAATKRCTDNHNERYYGNLGALRYRVFLLFLQLKRLFNKEKMQSVLAKWFNTESSAKQGKMLLSAIIKIWVKVYNDTIYWWSYVITVLLAEDYNCLNLYLKNKGADIIRMSSSLLPFIVFAFPFSLIVHIILFLRNKKNKV